jgi:hypothetical protein
MYIFYKLDEGHVEIIISENSFLKVANTEFIKTTEFLTLYSNKANEFKLFPSNEVEGKWFLEAYNKFLELNIPLPKWILNYFSIAFKNIEEGMPVSKALNLIKPAHRPKESKLAERDNNIYLDVIKMMEEGRSLFDSALELSEKYNLHESNIQKIYSAYKKIKSATDEEINIPF